MMVIVCEIQVLLLHRHKQNEEAQFQYNQNSNIVGLFQRAHGLTSALL